VGIKMKSELLPFLIGGTIALKSGRLSIRRDG
jgi:hypothetical protein